MAMVTQCPHCKKSIKIADESAGKQLRCPLCKKDFKAAAAPARQPAAVGAGAAAGGSSPGMAAAKAGGPPPAGRPRPAESVAAPAPAASATPKECPSCGSPLLPGAIACMDCGFLLQPDLGAEGDEGGKPNMCTNPACGVANAPTDKVCARCGSPLPTAPGTMLHGRYRIERQLAVGGFGAVYLATDTKNGNKAVAVKDMLCSDPQEFSIRLNFFRREAEILRSLEVIPIVPRVFDFIQEGQSAHLVLEFIKGKDLLKIMENSGNKPYPLPKVVAWAKAICDVLSHMHSQSPPLIHRDLKPDNIMLLEDMNSIKMIDFGTARDLGRTQKTRLAAKTRVYTEGYAPPEQIIGKPEPRSDLFALAGTLYHLATGKPPEGFYTAKELEAQLADTSSPLPADYRWLFELIKINLAEDANDRYFSAREIKADLDRQKVSTDLACPKCQAMNKVREPYCVKCAEPLTDPTPPCNHCGKNNRMGSRCCIHCGNRLR